MMLPESRCEVHGTPYLMSPRGDGTFRKYCNACRQERSGRRRQGGPTCWRGHIKTPWSWRWRPNTSGGQFYCYVCQHEKQNARNRARRERAS